MPRRCLRMSTWSGINYTNPVRAGYSLNIRDILNGLPPDAADDNFNTLRSVSAPSISGRRGAATAVTAARSATGLLRRRRGLAVSGRADAALGHAGRHQRHGPGLRRGIQGRRRRQPRAGRAGAGRVQQLFPAAGIAGRDQHQLHGRRDDRRRARQPTNGTTLGAIYFPRQQLRPTILHGAAHNPAGIAPDGGGAVYPYLPDVTSNPLHGFEAGRFPNQSLHAASRLSVSGGSPAGVDERRTAARST